MKLTDRIAVKTRYTRSTNVERDRGSLSIIQAYLPSSLGTTLLAEISDTFGNGDEPRAWSLIGPYGAGKSSFALFLYELLGLGTAKTAALDVLANEAQAVARQFRAQKPWCRVVLSGNDEPLPIRFLSALADAAVEQWADKRGRKPAVINRIRQARESGRITDRDLLELVDALLTALEAAGAGGLLVVVDELGKFLEYEARHGGAGIFLLQQLAERAFRGGKTNLALVVLLHQGFDLYARGLGQKLKNDWAKVQGRFQNVSFVETPEQILRLIAAAFSNTLTSPQRRNIEKTARRFAKSLAAANSLPSTLPVDDASRIFADCYPIHPVALLLLPDLCLRFAQNERTLFNYLGSREPHGFQDSLGSLHRIGTWLHPASVYDYFVCNQPAVLTDPLTHRRWAEVVTAVERADQLDPRNDSTRSDHGPSALARTIGLLNLVSHTGGLKASESVLQLLFPHRSPALGEAIRQLRKASVIQYRRFSNEFRVWQGTDFDIDERTNEESQKLGLFDLAEVLSSRADTTPVVARRHSAETGTLRYFNVAFADPSSGLVAATQDDRTPKIVFVLAEQKDHESAFDRFRKSARPSDIWVLHRDGSAIRTVIADVLALEGVQRTAQELASDPVAAREIKERLDAARLAEREALHRLLDEPAQSTWYRGNTRLKIADRRKLQQELSQSMDLTYAQTPLIRNELINRNRLSSQAAAARNKLFGRMLDHHSLPELGIQKYPPERAIYRSIFQAGRLHVETPDGWAFVKPLRGDPLNLFPAWTRLNDLMALSESAPISFEHLAEQLAEPPIGLRRGAFPILFLHYYLLHRYEIAFYEEGVYSPTLSYDHLERLVRRPDLFSFQRFRIEGVRATLFNEYGKALFNKAPGPTDPLPLARALVKFIHGLDDYTRKTRQLSDDTMRVRDALFLSKSPQKLLFEALPEACGFRADADLSGFAERLLRALRELNGASSALVDHMRRAFCVAFDLADDTPIAELRELLRGRCYGLEDYTIDTEGLKGLIRRLSSREPDADPNWFEGVLLFLGHKPTAKWTDQDRDTTEYRIAEFAFRLNELEKLRLHFTMAPRRRGPHEAVLVKTVSQETGELDEVALLTADKDARIANSLERIEIELNDIQDDDLQLALVARLSSRFLARYRNARISKLETARDRQKSG